MKYSKLENKINPFWVICIMIFSVTQLGCGSTKTSSSAQTTVKIKDIKMGTGAVATKGSKVTVHYVGTLTNGTKFDSSRDRNRPFTFEIGEGTVIEGWEIGVEGMKVGGIRKLTVPPELGYGDEDHNKIPANSILLFEIELLNVE